MSYSSASEGEIVESEGEKATTTKPFPKDSAVNRSNRPRSVSRSPRPPQLDGAYDDNHDGLDYGDNHRRRGERQRSYEPADRSPHGQKRRYEEVSHHDRGNGDPRRFKVHYEGRDPAHSRSNRSHGDDDYRNGADRFSRREEERRARGNGDRHRNRSRSPYRDGKTGYAGGNRGDKGNWRGHDRSSFREGRHDRQRQGDHGRYAEDDTRSRRSSTYSRESTPFSSRRNDHAESRRNSMQQDATTKDSTSDVHARSRGSVSDPYKLPGIADPNTSDAPPKAARESEDVAEPVVVDEAKLIEERRKRREALRAKHRAQEPSLLQKALHVDTASRAVTPGAESDRQTEPSGQYKYHASRSAADSPAAVPSPSIQSPSTPQPDSAPGSPAMFAVANDEELANPAQRDTTMQDHTDGPSAADYDPSMDMQEDRRHRTAQSSEPAASAYNELQEKDRIVIVPKDTPKPQEVPKQEKEFDMFADEDDDDMFAPEPTLGHKKEDGTQVERVPEAKQLDRSMLDDWDDPEGYYRIILGELLDGRYHVQTNLGKGVFSAVVRAKDTTTNKDVAIKIIRTQETMYRAGMKEIETLQKIAEADPEDKKHVIRLERHFEHKGHLCMVFESLSDNLREVLKKFGRDVGINIKAVRSYAQQMFLGLSLLKKCEILHADLKPDNVLVTENRSSLKIADLGSAIDARDNEITDTLVSRFYRAPEIMLGMPYDYAIDMWSIGCTLFELYTGKICFTGSTNNQMLKGIMECRGKIPNRMLKKAAYWDQHFSPDGTFQSQEYDNIGRRDVIRPMVIAKTVPAKELKSRVFGTTKGLSPADARELGDFVDLLERCLAVDPTRRITPTEALKHKFINRSMVPTKI
ncbi:U4/U6 small nuclear ribonucleoprotein prp4 [Zalaria obscura]|uniref:U4/U6 small nuclear ribonucleoprotein prp4 n=1 Tax=Zalaria obscura TaxID=2024903 RepID=A0ACC3S3K8_9PEZI